MKERANKTIKCDGSNHHPGVNKINIPKLLVNAFIQPTTTGSWHIKMHSKKQISTLLVLLLIALEFCFGLKVLNADNNATFPNCPIEEISNLAEFFDRTFLILAGKMRIEINSKVPKPIILTDIQITPQKFSSYLGFEVEGLIPYYFSSKNIVVIPLNCKLDSLAHELVHYFQVVYRNENLGLDCGPDIENLEVEAVSIQRWFKAKYLDPQKPEDHTAAKFSHLIVTFP